MEEKQFKLPNKLDTAFLFIAELYIIFLVSPSISLILVENFSILTSIVLFTFIISIIILSVMWIFSQYEWIGDWLGSTWFAWILPATGAIPVFGFLGSFIRYVVTDVTKLSAEGVTNTISFAGFLLGITATVLGSALIYIARVRLVDSALGDQFFVEWEAGWPQREKTRIMLVIVSILVVLAATREFWDFMTTSLIISIGISLIGVIIGLASDRKYRATPEGLAQHMFVFRRFIPWRQIEGFRVTEHTIILRQKSPNMDIRISRSDVIEKEDNIISVLEDQVERLK